MRSRPPYIAASSADDLVRFWLWLPALIGGIALARRNLIRGLGDRRAAGRLALVVGLGELMSVILDAEHTTQLVSEQWILVRCLSAALYDGVLVWVLYLALEPYVRRIWPDRLVSWSRLFAGRWRDALVARDVMAGLGAGILAALANFARVWIGRRLEAPQATPSDGNFPDSDGLRGAIAQLCNEASSGLEASLILLFSLVVLRYFVRRSWIAYLLFAPVVVANPYASSTGLAVLDWGVSLFLAVLLVLLVARFGLLALAVFVATFSFLNDVPLTVELNAWYANQTIFAGLLSGGLALVAARFAVGKRVQVS